MRCCLLTLALFLSLPARAQYEIEGSIFGSAFGSPTYTETLAILDQMRAQFPHLISARSSIGQTAEGRDLWVVEVGDNPGVDEGEPESLFMALLHGPEPLGLTTTLHTMWYLLEQYGTDPEVTYLLDHRRLFVLPIVNPDGYAHNLNFFDGGSWLKNRATVGGTNGVNLDHNFGYQWGAGGASCTHPYYECFLGFAPFSELETQAVRAFVNGRHLRTALTYHSFHHSPYRADPGRQLYSPWGYDILAPPEADVLDRMAETLVEENGYREGALGGSSDFVDGSASDWLFGATDEHARVYAFDLVIGFEEDWVAPARITALAEENVRAGLDLLWYAGAFVTPLDFAVTDTGAGANGHLDPGESGQVSVRVRNDGGATAQGVRFRLRSASPLLTVGSAWSALVTIAPGDSATVGPFSLAADAARPLGVSDDLSLEVSYAPSVATARLLPDLAVGTPEVLYAWDGTSLADWCQGSWCPPPVWGLVPDAHSPPTAFHDSPDGFADPGGYNQLNTRSPLVLTGPGPYYLSFWAKWQTYAYHSYGKVFAVDVPVTQRLDFPTRHTHPAADFPVQYVDLGEPIFDGAQFRWVREVADLTPFVDVPFNLWMNVYPIHGAGSFPSDGFYIDDIEVFRLVDERASGFDLSATNTSALTVEAGGEVAFAYSATNNTAAPAAGDLFFTVQPGALAGVVRSGTLPAGQTVTGTFTQSVPASAPPGEYTYTLRIGRYPNTTVDEVPFTITVTPSARLEESGPEAWAVVAASEWGESPSAPAALADGDPTAYALGDAAPNPFAVTTTIRYALPAATAVRLAVYDVLGREVALLVDGVQMAGHYQAAFDGSGLGAGVYVYRLEAGGFAAVGRMTRME